MKKYKSTAPCGFCKFFGRVCDNCTEDVCWDCELRRIREHLEILTDKATWDHHHKYLPDSDEYVHNCAHCKHALPEETLFHSAQHRVPVCCELDIGKPNDSNYLPTHSASSNCEHWERAVDRSN